MELVIDVIDIVNIEGALLLKYLGSVAWNISISYSQEYFSIDRSLGVII